MSVSIEFALSSSGVISNSELWFSESELSSVSLGSVSDFFNDVISALLISPFAFSIKGLTSSENSSANFVMS